MKLRVLALGAATISVGMAIIARTMAQPPGTTVPQPAAPAPAPGTPANVKAAPDPAKVALDKQRSEKHKELLAALHSLSDAQAHLRKETGDYNGYRTKAYNDVREGISNIQKAILWDNGQTKKP